MSAARKLTDGKLFREDITGGEAAGTFKGLQQRQQPKVSFPVVAYECQRFENGFWGVWHFATDSQGECHATLLAVFIPAYAEHAKWLMERLTNTNFTADLARLQRENRFLAERINEDNRK